VRIIMSSSINWLSLVHERRVLLNHVFAIGL
jgi:hypothetical protein